MAKGHEGDSNIAKWDLSFVVYAAKVLGFTTSLRGLPTIIKV